MDEKNSENSDGNFGNFGAGAKVFAPPSDGAGINAPRENAEKPQFHGDTYAKIAAAEEKNVQNNLAGNVAGAQNLANNLSSPAQNLQNPQNLNLQTQTPADGGISAAPKIILHPAARIITMIFGVISAIYFGFVVFRNVADLLADAMNSVGSSYGYGATETAKHIWTGAEIASVIISIFVFFCMVVLIWASIRVVKFDNDGRKLWLKASAISGGIFLLSIGSIIWRIVEISGLTFSGAEIARSLFLMIILNSAIPILIFVGGWILLTRKSVRNWFS